jgi:uncharacterized membrane protein YeiH
MKYEFLNLIDILGTVAFSISGVFAAMQKRLDVFGVFIIAFITAIGGGSLRDILIGDLPVTWIRSMNYTWIILGSSVLAILFNNPIRNFEKTLAVFDSLGLGFFTVLGIQKGIDTGLDPGICVALGTVTGCFGGVIRDISLNNIPLIFHKEIYATACIVGGSIYFLLPETRISRDWAEIISIASIVIIRLTALQYDLRLPSIYRNKERWK